MTMDTIVVHYLVCNGSELTLQECDWAPFEFELYRYYDSNNLICSGKTRTHQLPHLERNGMINLWYIEQALLTST